MLKNHINTILISLAVIITGYLLANGYKNRGKLGQSISVTGLGEQNFTSDLIVWRGSFSSKDMDLKRANNQLNKDMKEIRSYLKSKGLKDDEIIFEGVNIGRDYYYDYDQYGTLRNTIFNGYVLTQNLKVQSNNVDLVESISRQVTDLLDKGVEFNSYSPEFYYTKLSELKLKMIESATADARERAEKIAANAGGELGALKNAEMGVFQITAENSSEDFSWGGSFNTSSKKKNASITVRLKYEID
jgi:uncharacterized protein